MPRRPDKRETHPTTSRVVAIAKGSSQSSPDTSFSESVVAKGQELSSRPKLDASVVGSPTISRATLGWAMQTTASAARRRFKREDRATLRQYQRRNGKAAVRTVVCAEWAPRVCQNRRPGAHKQLLDRSSESVTSTVWQSSPNHERPRKHGVVDSKYREGWKSGTRPGIARRELGHVHLKGSDIESGSMLDSTLDRFVGSPSMGSVGIHRDRSGTTLERMQANAIILQCGCITLTRSVLQTRVSQQVARGDIRSLFETLMGIPCSRRSACAARGGHQGAVCGCGLRNVQGAREPAGKGRGRSQGNTAHPARGGRECAHGGHVVAEDFDGGAGCRRWWRSNVRTQSRERRRETSDG